MRVLFCSMDTQMSRKFMERCDLSSVNLMVLCWLFRWVMNLSSSRSPCCQMMNISSIYLFHKAVGIRKYRQIYLRNHP